MPMHRALHLQTTPLPWDDRPAPARRTRAGALQLAPEAVARFDALLHEVHPDAQHVDPDRIASLARWLLTLPEAQARAFLDERLQRIEHLRAMLGDADWDRRDDACARVRTLLAYLDQELDLIPDRIPLLGLLDDVLLVELAWPAVATEADDYRDFCRFRDEAHPAGDGGQRRAAWIRARLQALALFRHQQEVHARHYAASGEPGAPFRIC